MQSDDTEHAATHRRLSAQDASFLEFESDVCPMHVGGMSLFEAGPLATATGGLDIERFTKHVASKLDAIPVYRQKLARTPISGWPVWVDDEDFDIARHVRHVALPQPGSESQLKTLVSRILSKPLDPDRPLWEMWAVEGIEDNRFALIAKIHHSVIDGAKGVHIMTQLYSTESDETPRIESHWQAQPPPTPLDLLMDDVSQRMTAPASLLESTWQGLRSFDGDVDSLRDRWSQISHTVGLALRSMPDSPLNGTHGRDRQCDWVEFDLSRLRGIRKNLGGTINDVVLAVVCGALRRLILARGEWVGGDELRVAVPVNTRPEGDSMEDGNRVGAMLVSLPLGEPDAGTRFEAIRRQTGHEKEMRAAEGIDLFMQLADALGSASLMRAGTQLTQRLSPFNLIITNVRGPDFPLYILGAKLIEFIPQLPLFETQGLGVAVMSYLNHMSFGFIADPIRVPDLATLPDRVEAELAALEALTGDEAEE